MFGFNGFIFAQPVADIVTTVIAIMLSLSFLKEIHALRFSDTERESTEKLGKESDLAAFVEYSSQVQEE